MKIVHIMECFAGGTFNFLVDLTNELYNEEHIVIYGTNRENTPKNFKDLFNKNVKFIKWKTAQREMKPLKDIKALWELYNILKKIDDIDIIHLHSSKAGFLGRIVSFLLGKSNKTIYTPHAISFLRLDVSPKKRKIFIWMEKFASLFGGKIVACSQSEKEAIEEQGIKNVTFINNGIKLLQVEKKVNTSDKITIISVGRLSIQKNPKLFNDIALEFIDNPNIQFIWCGDGELKSELNSSNIKCTGWIDRKALENYLANADVYLSTSLWEGLPLSVLEAMSIGLPVVLSDCVGNRDLVENNGFLYNNKLEAVKIISYYVENRNLLIENGLKSKKIFDRDFKLENMANLYYRLYRSLYV
ncbi:glycosyltransferase [uncultured Megamonas sp.]|uniref:glycosyltransferase n=1 Tax=uncultured Megamonas sp. TaxID=286140 RepID=UPI0025CBFAF0|nr:glycosyltransferase [uncultured Megamonas sp.]